MTRSRIIRVMVIDDEAPARSELRYQLEQHDDVCVVFEASNYQEALSGIRQCNPHLVFLDIEMPGMNGVAVAEKILEICQPLIVFATAHEEFALKAFELNAVDYLLKPFSAKRIEQCIEKVRSLIAARSPVAPSQENAAAGEVHCCKSKLAIEHGGKTQLVKISDIIAACSSEGSVEIHTPGKVYTLAIPLQDLQAKLDENVFFRSHRGCIVNIEKVREIIPWFNGTYNLIMEGLPDTEFPVSRQQAPKLKKIFGL